MVAPRFCLNVALSGEPRYQSSGDDILLLAWLHTADEPVGNGVPQAVGYVSRQADRDSNRLHACIALPFVVLAFAPLGGAQGPGRWGFTGRAFRFTVHRQTSQKARTLAAGSLTRQAITITPLRQFCKLTIFKS
jgi:hypothetical protein